MDAFSLGKLFHLMAEITETQLLDRLNWRYATKLFDADRRIPEETLIALEEALRLAPSSFGLQPWKFILVSDPQLKASMPAISWGQTQPQDCSHMALLLVKRAFSAQDVRRFVQRTAEVTGRPLESLAPYEEMAAGFVSQAAQQGWALEWNKRQVYIALGQLMTAAALLGVDSCPIEGIDAAAYDKLLGLEGSEYQTVVGCALGYRSTEDKYASQPKVRYAKSEVVERR